MSTRIRDIPLDKLLPHPGNPSSMSRASLAKLVRNIERTGCYEPLVVRPHPGRRGAFQIINGHHRCEALRRLGHTTADAVVWDVDDEQTAILLTTLNRLGGRDALDKKLALLRRVRRRMPVADLAKLLPQTRGQIERLLAHKPLPRRMPDGPDTFAIPVVFFVSAVQQSVIEKALLAANPASSGDGPASPGQGHADGKTRTARRAAALTCLAQSSLDLMQREADR
jgi:ParB/RepB/Spo0J family partition protein